MLSDEEFYKETGYTWAEVSKAIELLKVTNRLRAEVVLSEFDLSKKDEEELGRTDAIVKDYQKYFRISDEEYSNLIRRVGYFAKKTEDYPSAAKKILLAMKSYQIGRGVGLASRFRSPWPKIF